MRDSLERFIENGGNVAFFSGNAVFWQVRFEDDWRTMVCHKYVAHESDPVLATEREHLMTGMWSDPLVGRPENALTGVSFTRGGYVRSGGGVPRGSGGYVVHRHRHWAFEGTDLRYGDLLGASDGVVGYEADGCELILEDGWLNPTGRDGTPKDFTVLATSPAHLWSHGVGESDFPERYRDLDEPGDLEFTALRLFGDASEANTRRLANGNAVMGTYTRGGTVFTVGCTDWAYGLGDPAVARITRNVLDRLSV